jgi:NADPH2:quinone reductase
VQALAAESRLHPLVGATYPLTQASAALASLENRTAMGKVVVTLPGK